MQLRKLGSTGLHVGGDPSAEFVDSFEKRVRDDSKPFFPSIMGYASSLGTASRTYRNPDEALKYSPDNARTMEADLSIVECLHEQYMSLSMIPADIIPEDDKDPSQVEEAELLKAIWEKTPNRIQLIWWLHEAMWYGKNAVQLCLDWKRVKGKRVKAISRWIPILGDKLAFGWDDPTRVAIRTGWFPAPASLAEVVDPGSPLHADNKIDIIGGKERRIMPIDTLGRGYFLDDYEKSRFIIHKFLIRDLFYEDAFGAGAINGMGYRSFVYWTWYQKQAIVSMLMEYVERGAFGLRLWYYERGNNADLIETKQAAAQHVSGGQMEIFVPTSREDPVPQKFDLIQNSIDGIRMMRDVIHEYHEWSIKRLISGQVLSSEPEAGGLGSSGITDFQGENLDNRSRFRSESLGETLTQYLIPLLKNRNRHILPQTPGTRFSCPQFVFRLEDDDSAERMAMLKEAVGVGLKIKEDTAYEITGFERPSEDDAILQPPGGQEENPLAELMSQADKPAEEKQLKLFEDDTKSDPS